MSGRAALAGLALLAPLLLLLCGPARAASCNVSVESLNFGAVDTLYGQAVDTAGTVAVDCDQVSDSATSVTVCVHIGAGSGGAGNGQRHMRTASGAALAYQIYADPAHSVGWGSSDNSALGRPQAVVMPAANGRASGRMTLYARAFAGQPNAVAGAYGSSFSGLDAFYLAAEGDSLDCLATFGSSFPLTFEARAVVPENCLVETSDIAFGHHGLIESPIDAVGGIGITCTLGTPYTVSLSGGLSGASDPERRIMRSGANEVRYGIYQDAGRSQPWGDAAGTLATGTGTGQRVSAPVYGRVPPQRAAPGTYTDTLSVTITYEDPGS
ncbi:Csu type fimbrial protein [Aureimonas populi]|uniref:Spore coat protein U domain-containing protein n=1 Tax=Aureimonas populi TaxID=1701758 RepID=A0ABW5CQD3_9HYPH|nr:spore coat protein U domain-containing protein [Aureimonas populi]